jgi:hypothetical protein
MIITMWTTMLTSHGGADRAAFCVGSGGGSSCFSASIRGVPAMGFALATGIGRGPTESGRFAAEVPAGTGLTGTGRAVWTVGIGGSAG